MKNLERLLPATVILVTLISAGLVFHLTLRRQKLFRENNRLISKGLEDLKSAEQASGRLASVLDKKRRELAEFNAKIPETFEFGAFLDQLDRMMTLRNLTLISVKPQTGIPEKTLTRYPIRMVFNGTFINIFNMIHTMETNGKTVVMEKIDIVKSAVNDQCRVELVANIFSW